MYIQYILVSKKIYYEKLTGIKNYLRFNENAYIIDFEEF